MGEREIEQLSLFNAPENNPFDCPYELAVVDIGGGKTECNLMQCWTNCREVQHCTAGRCYEIHC